MSRKLVWPCRLIGHTHTYGGRRRQVNAVIDGAGDVIGAIYRYMNHRRNSVEWLGVELTAITPLGQRVKVVYEPHAPWYTNVSNRAIRG